MIPKRSNYIIQFNHASFVYFKVQRKMVSRRTPSLFLSQTSVMARRSRVGSKRGPSVPSVQTIHVISLSSILFSCLSLPLTTYLLILPAYLFLLRASRLLLRRARPSTLDARRGRQMVRLIRGEYFGMLRSICSCLEETVA